MTLRDFRCHFSGVSLMGSEAALVLILQEGETWLPMSLPLWGRYEGLGSLSEIQEGPNAALILRVLQSALVGGTMTIDWQGFSLESHSLEHLEEIFSLLACGQIQGNFPMKWEGKRMGFTLLSAHVAAALMEADDDLPSGLSLEALPEVILGEGSRAAFYEGLARSSMRLRCKFGLSFVGLAALKREMSQWEYLWSPTCQGFEAEEADSAQWLAQALLKFSEHEILLTALEEHAFQGTEEA